jgi:predicted Zn-dependent protease
MAHVLRRHAMDRLMANAVISAAVGRWTRGGGWISQPVTGVVTGLLNQGYSQDQELEADRIGVELARAAGFDTTAAARLLARLQAHAGDTSVLGGYFSSHPPLAVRVEQLNRLPTGR